jgi:4-phytase/acid phosphatase
VPRGHLTANGHILEGLLGAYYRRLYGGLLPAGQCGALYVWANNLERTIETGRALAEGLQPDCPPDIHTVGNDKSDPLFDPIAAGVAHPDYDLALAAVAGRVGNDPAAWARTHRADLQALQDLLGGSAKLADTPSVLARGQGSDLAHVENPFTRASSLSESLLMAYADGLPLDAVTGGRLTEERLRDAQAAHALDLDMQLRAPYVGKVTASHLAFRLLATIEGGPAGIGGGNSAVTAIVGHDGTIVELGSLLDLHWLLAGYQPDQVPPGGALRFELWRRGADGREVVRLSLTAQSLSQLRERQPLSLEKPPLTAPVFIPGCSEAGPSYDCPLDGFARRVAEAADPAFAGR